MPFLDIEKNIDLNRIPSGFASNSGVECWGKPAK